MIFHLCEKKEWNQVTAESPYSAASLKKEGFIHFSSYGQLLSVANHLYLKAEDPVILCVDNNKISEKDLIWEGPQDLKFPHLYRSLQKSEVLKVITLNRDAKGYFSHPEFDEVGESVRLTTDRLVLREFQLSDLEAVHQYASDKDLVEYMIWGPNQMIDTNRFLSTVFEWQTEKPRDEFHFVISLKSDGRLLGACNITIESVTHQTAAIGYILNRNDHGQGYATEASQALVQFGFRSLGMNRIYATCDQDNKASLSVMKKIGMKQEGLLRQNMVLKGRRRNTYMCSILKSESEP